MRSGHLRILAQITLLEPARLAGGVSDPRSLCERIFGMKCLSFIGVLVAVCAALGVTTQWSQPASAASTIGGRVVPVHFTPANGWHLRKGKVHACPGVPASRCSEVRSLASTTRWRDCVECLPHRTVAAMRGDGIAIQISVAIERPVRVARTFAWPPRVSGPSVHAGFEGLPGRIGVYQGSTLVGKRELSVFVFFGRSRPTARQLHSANAELRRSHFG